MSAASNWLEDQILNITLRGQAWTTIPAPYVALFTTDPTDAGTGTEVTGGAYARQAGTFDAPSTPGTTQNSAVVQFPTATEDWGTVTHVGIYDAVTGGNLLYHGPLTSSRIINTGGSLRFPEGDLVVRQA